MKSFIPLIVFSIGMLCGHLAERAKQARDLSSLETLRDDIQRCDTEVLRTQKELSEATEAFWKALGEKKSQ
jgi:hypothetical protein